MTKDDIIQMALECDLLDSRDDLDYPAFAEIIASVERFYHLVAAAERNQNTQLLYQMHERAADQHNYYKHAAIEINRKARSQS